MKPTIYRITHLWPNKQPGHGSTTAQIEEDGQSWTIHACDRCGQGHHAQYAGMTCLAVGADCDGTVREVAVIPLADKDSSTVQIKPETDEPNALPSRFVSLQDYERLERDRDKAAGVAMMLATENRALRDSEERLEREAK